MDTRQLAAFCEVVERRSFSDAATRLGVTQPAVSQQVRALEQRLGTQLLDRSGRRVEPTEAGLRLYRGAQRLLAMEEQLLEELAEPQGPLVRQMVEDELRKTGRKVRDLEAPLELGLQESVRSAVQAGYGVSFISRRAVESDLAVGTLAEARVKGLDLAREIWIARAAGRAGSAAAQAFVAFAQEQLAK